MTAPVVQDRGQAPVHGTPLGHAIRSEFTKIFTLRAWWVGIAVLVALTLYFAYLNTTVLLELAEGSWAQGRFEDFDGSEVTVTRAVRESMLAGPYQSAIFFLPVLVALMVGQEYRTQQFFTSVTAVSSRTVLFAAKLVAVVVVSVTTVTATFVASDVVLVAMLPPEADVLVLSGPGLLVAPRLAFFAAVTAIIAAAVTSIVRSTLWALVAAILGFVLPLTGVLRAIAPVLHDAMPVIGAKAFMFGFADGPDAPGVGVGGPLLLAWGCVGAVSWWLAYTKRDAA